MVRCGAAVGALVGAAVLAVPTVGTAQALGAPGSRVEGAQAAAAAVCSTPWGSTGESAGALSTAALRDVRGGRHRCFDRLVFDLGRSRVGYHVRYVADVHAQGSGDVVALRGGASLQVDLLHPAYDAKGRPTYVPSDPRELVSATGYRTLRQAAWGGSFEGQTTVGVGVRARLPFRAFALHTATASKLVLDVAHRW